MIPTAADKSTLLAGTALRTNAIRFWLGPHPKPTVGEITPTAALSARDRMNTLVEYSHTHTPLAHLHPRRLRASYLETE